MEEIAAEKEEKKMGIDKKIGMIRNDHHNRNFPIAGDFVELPDGRLARLSVIREGQRVQVVGDHASNISIYLEPGLFPVNASGSVWDSDFDDVDVDLLALIDTGKTKTASAWTFRGMPEAGGDVWFDIDFKVWKI